MGGSSSTAANAAAQGGPGEDGKTSTEVERTRISPADQVLKSDFSSNIELSLRMEDLQKPGTFFVMVYAKWSQDTHWLELGRTEQILENGSAPCFKKTFNLEFKVESQRHLRFEAYRVRDANALEDLSYQKFLGAADCCLVDVMMARAKATNSGWLVKELKQPLQRPGEPPPGKLCMYAEEDTNAKQTVAFVLAGASIKSTDLWKLSPDAYCIVNRSIVHEPDEEDEDEGEIELLPVYRTEVARKTRKPRWKRCELSAMQLCGSGAQNDQDIVIEVYDWFRVSGHRYIGECVVTLQDISKAFRESRPLIRPLCIREGKRKALAKAKKAKGSKTGSKISAGSRSNSRTGSKASGLSGKAKRMLMGSKDSRASGSKSQSGNSQRSSGSPTSGGSVRSSKSEKPAIFGKVVGDLIFEDIGLMRAYTFLDYIRGGLELKLAVGIDLTRSNAGPTEPGSFHRMDESGADSAYATAIRAVGDVMKAYDADDKYPVYGFGAQIPPSLTVCSDCFSLTGDFWDPEVEGVDGIIRAYKRALHITRLHGPSHIHEVIKLCTEMARPYAEAMTPPINGVEMKYFVFLILTDGEVHQQQKVVDQIMESLDLPMSIVIIGIGDADFTFMRALSEDISSLRKAKEAKAPPNAKKEPTAAEKMVAQAAAAGSKRKGKKDRTEGPRPTVLPRDIVHFVSYNEYRDRPAELAAATLMELPKEVVSYYTGKNVMPRGLDKLEDENGNPVAKTIPTAPSKADGSKSRSGTKLSGAGSRSATKLSGAGDGTESKANSRASSTLSTPEARGEKELKKKLESLPPFVRDERERLIKEAERLGYEKFQINRALKDGVPAASIEALVDVMLNGGYGKSPCYKDAAESAIAEPVELELSRLPGQPDRMPSMLSSLTDFDFGSKSIAGTPSGRFNMASKSASKNASKSISNWGSRMGTKLEDVKGNSKEALLSGLNSRWGTKEPDASGQGREGTKEAMLRANRKSTRESVGSMGSLGSQGSNKSPGGSGQPSRPSKSILKAASRETSKEFTGNVVGIGGSRRYTIGSTKESLASDGSLRGAANVRFQDDEAFPGAPGGTNCGVCFENLVSTEFKPCGHRIACSSCAAKLQDVTCPLCRTVVREVVQLP